MFIDVKMPVLRCLGHQAVRARRKWQVEVEIYFCSSRIQRIHGTTSYPALSYLEFFRITVAILDNGLKEGLHKMSMALAVFHGKFGRAAIYQLDRPLATHTHREGHFVMYVRGECPTMSVRGREFSLGPGNVGAINPWEPHAFHSSPTGGACILLVVYIDQGWFSNSGGDFSNSIKFGCANFDMTQEISQLVNNVTTLLLTGCNDQTLVGLRLYEMARISSRESWRQHANAIKRTGHPDELKIFRPNCSDSRIRKAVELMSKNVNSEVLLGEIANASGLSRPHFFKLFKNQTGITPNLYLNTLRMETAISNLIKTDKTVEEIGRGIGFASQASFSRFFITNVGIPPSDYRRVADSPKAIQ